MNADQLAFNVVTFERPKQAQRCVNSILDLWPQAKIYQADNSREPRRLNGVHQFWHIGHDVGVSAARNHLIRHTREPFLVQIDDDYIFTPEADVLRLAALLDENENLALAGCKCRHIRGNGRTGWTKYYARVRLDGHKLIADRPGEKYRRETQGLPWYEVDVVSNFWVAKRRLFDNMMWDERLKIGGEHADFFQRLQAANGDEAMMARILERRRSGQDAPLVPIQDPGRLGVAFVPSMWITHRKERPGQYARFRKRDKTYEQMYRGMWGISRVDRWRKRKR